MKTTIKKPVLDAEKALQFATGAKGDRPPTKRGKAPQKGAVSLSGLVPAGDVRISANIREDLHLRLKMEATKRRTTIGEIIEGWIEKNL